MPGKLRVYTDETAKPRDSGDDETGREQRPGSWHSRWAGGRPIGKVGMDAVDEPGSEERGSHVIAAPEDQTPDPALKQPPDTAGSTVPGYQVGDGQHAVPMGPGNGFRYPA